MVLFLQTLLRTSDYYARPARWNLLTHSILFGLWNGECIIVFPYTPHIITVFFPPTTVFARRFRVMTVDIYDFGLNCRRRVQTTQDTNVQ